MVLRVAAGMCHCRQGRRQGTATTAVTVKCASTLVAGACLNSSSNAVIVVPKSRRQLLWAVDSRLPGIMQEVWVVCGAMCIPCLVGSQCLVVIGVPQSAM